MDPLTNIKIKTVKKAKSGKNDYGPWTLFIVRVEDPDWKDQDLTFFQKKDTKVMPEEGKEYAIMELDETDRGYQIKKLTLKGEKPKPNKAKAESQGANARWKGLHEEYLEWAKDPRYADCSFADYVAWKNNPKSMYYAYAERMVEKMLELAMFEADDLAIAAKVVYFAQTWHKCSSGDEEILSRMREVCKSNGRTGTGERSSDTEHPREPEQDEEGKPEDEGPGPDDITDEKASQMAIEWVAHFKEIDNLNHLKNWMNKALKDEDTKFIIKYFEGIWQQVMEAFNRRHDELREEFKKKKEEK